MRKKWGIKKNTRKDDRKRLLRELENGGISEEGNIGAVSLNVEKVNRWRKEMNERNERDSYEGEDLPETRVPRLANICEVYNSGRSPTSSNGQLSRVVTAEPLVARQPASQAFHVTEGLLFSIDAYVAGMYDQRYWTIESNRSLQPVSSNSEESQDAAYAVLDKFYSGCITAFELIEEKKFVEARKILSGACALLRSIITSGHRETLNYLLTIFFDLTHGRFKALDGVLDLLRNYLGSMAMLVLPERHPYRAICCSLGKMDVNELSQAILLSLKSLVDVSERKGGPYSQSAIRSRINYISLKHADQPLEGELALRKLLSEVRGRSFDGMFNAMKFLVINLRAQGRIEECEAIGTEYLAVAEAYTGRGATDVDISIGLQIIARAQYQLGKTAMAEVNQRKHVDIMLATGNLTWAIRSLKILESWIRDSGRKNDADDLVKEIERLIEQDTAGKEDIY